MGVGLTGVQAGVPSTMHGVHTPPSATLKVTLKSSVYPWYQDLACTIVRYQAELPAFNIRIPPLLQPGLCCGRHASALHHSMSAALVFMAAYASMHALQACIGACPYGSGLLSGREQRANTSSEPDRPPRVRFWLTFCFTGFARTHLHAPTHSPSRLHRCRSACACAGTGSNAAGCVSSVGEVAEVQTGCDVLHVCAPGCCWQLRAHGAALSGQVRCSHAWTARTLNGTLNGTQSDATALISVCVNGFTGVLQRCLAHHHAMAGPHSSETAPGEAGSLPAAASPQHRSELFWPCNVLSPGNCFESHARLASLSVC